MKVKLDISDEYSEKTIVIQSPKDDQEVVDLVQKLESMIQELQKISGYHDDTVYQLDLTEVLFFETNDRDVYAHTSDNSYRVNQRLYELEEILPANFIRVSKSTILNLDQVRSLTRSVTGNLIEFKNSYKQVYVSRRFYKDVKIKLGKKDY
ncbi:LytTR family DNA-binding domain-containing protein [Companilactobacillus metriopterae]|uniref:LytTR family DNA-binding domain-containing protein n=1 Tax=Companilactobacillus metriopterae TaxID=1909267 RepID=UPI00100A630B|nr:LytTR family DNA-binding domain-containing protein [Companilactobacillus metriopterae]